MKRKPRVRLKREVFLILAGVLLLALAVQITHSSYVLEFSENEQLSEQTHSWKKRAAEHADWKPSGAPICLAFDSSDEGAALIQKQAVRLLQYMKKPVRSHDVQQSPLNPEGCEAVITTSPLLGKLGDPDTLAGYVEQGGYVLFAMTLDPDDAYYRIYRKLGILNVGELSDQQGIKLVSNVLIGQKGLVIEEDFMINSVLTIELDDKSRVLATTVKGVPLLWERSYGKGKFMVFNGTMLQEKVNRGVLAGAISMLIPDFIYPAFNSKVMFIDDFPAPIRKGIDRQIYQEYKRDIPTFFRDIWWPDMLKSAKRNNVKYTAVLIESYHDEVEPPFENPVDADKKGLVSYGREVIKSEGEIGLHGYNHQSLQTDQAVADEFGYNAWSGVEPMTESVEEAVRFIKSAFPSYKITTYVPPSNVLSPTGREALKKAMPNLAIISSLYNDDANGVGYIQEFEVAKDGILEMPRISSGYMLQQFDKWSLASALTTFGYISHFIHPDDLFDDKRNYGLGWKQLHKGYEEMLSDMNDAYPWIRATTSTEAGIAAANTLTSQVSWDREGNTIQGKVEPYSGEAYFFMRTDKSFKGLEGCKVRKIDDGTYLITALQADFALKMGD